MACCSGPHLRVNPEAVTAAQAEFAQGRMAGAEVGWRALAEAATDSSERAEALHWLGRCLVGDGRAREAVEVFQQALELSPDEEMRVRLWEGLGHAYLALDDPEKAFETFEKIERADGAARGRAVVEGEALYWLGIAAARAGEWSSAEEAFRRATAGSGDGWAADRARLRLPLAHLRRYALQVGLFADASRADDLARKASRAGLLASTLPVPGGKGLRHVVFVGDYEKWSEARADQDRVRGLGFDAVAVP